MTTQQSGREVFSPEAIAAFRREKGNGMTSAVGEYTPPEFWDALDEIERLQAALSARAQQGREVEAGEKARYIATFYPQQQIRWLGGDCFPADPGGETEWDCTEYVTKNYTAAEIREMQDDNVGSEQLDRVRDDPNAPEWVREWDGPFEVRIAEAEATPAPKQQAVGEAVAWRFWVDDPNSCLNPHWTEWSANEDFKTLSLKLGHHAEYAYPPDATPAARAVEVTEEMVERALASYNASRGTYSDEVPTDRDDIRAALLAALPGKTEVDRG